MRLQIIFLLENMFFDQDNSINLSGFKFTANQELFTSFFDEITRANFGASQCVYVKGSGIVYYDEIADFETIGIDESTLSDNLDQSVEHKLDLLKSFINSLWLVKDNSIAIQGYTAKLIPTKRCCMDVITPTITNAAGEVAYYQFNIADLQDAHKLWDKYRACIPIPEKYEKQKTPIMRVSQSQLIRTRAKTHHKGFDYSKTNCIERAFHFIGIARNQDYHIYKIAFYMAAFECLFTTGSNEIVKTMAYRASFYLGGNPEYCKITFDMITDAYAIRSKFLHGQKFENDSKIESTQLVLIATFLDVILREIFTRIITKDLEIFTIYGNKEREDYLNSLVFFLPFDREFAMAESERKEKAKQETAKNKLIKEQKTQEHEERRKKK